MALNPLVSLFGRLVARSGRISGTGQTDGLNDRPCSKYYNPRCACAPRVNDVTTVDLRTNYTTSKINGMCMFM